MNTTGKKGSSMSRITGFALASAIAALTGCSEEQPRNACSVQVTIGRYGVGGFASKYTLKSASGEGCEGYLGTSTVGAVTGETIGVTLYGRQGDIVALKPLSAALATDGDGTGQGAFVVDPAAAGGCTAATLSDASFVMSDPSWVAPDPLPDPAPAAPQVAVTYAFSNVHFVQASNIPGTQLTADLKLHITPADEGGDGAKTCQAELRVDGVWYANAYAPCFEDADCGTEAQGLPGKDADYMCQAFVQVQQDDLSPDGDGSQLARAKRCVPRGAAPVGAIE